MPLPKAILFDLDDTIIRAYAKPEDAWGRLLARFAARLDATTEAARLVTVRTAIIDEGRRYWGDPKVAAIGRLDIVGARRRVVRQALAGLGRDDDTLASDIADGFTALRVAEYALYPDAHDTLDKLKAAGVRMALITNGPAVPQRAKVVRFDLERRFEHVQIEGEFGKGKPEPEVYDHALSRLGVRPRDAWMVGDNLEWEVATPQRLGIHGIWYDPHLDGLPANAPAAPDRIINRLAELLD